MERNQRMNDNTLQEELIPSKEPIGGDGGTKIINLEKRGYSWRHLQQGNNTRRFRCYAAASNAQNHPMLSPKNTH
jgi:hypothetical protein